MRMTYHDLLGMQVIDAAGAHVGRVADLVAGKRGETLCVTGLLVGRSALVQRIGFTRESHPPLEIPWELVSGITADTSIQLGVTREYVEHRRTR